MQFKWIVDQADCKAVRTFVDGQEERTFVRARVQRNVNGPVPQFSREEFWRALLMCLLTTQQRSGPESAVTRFLFREPFPLGLADCLTLQTEQEYVHVLQGAGGIRRSTTIGKQLKTNLAVLEEGGWLFVEETARRLIKQRLREPELTDKVLERNAAAIADDGFEGIGPKQSRNLWQFLGLTRYEIPLDSRITKWLKKAHFPLSVSASSLSDSDYYNLIMDGVQALCDASGVLPCVLDAAIFASYDPDWNEERIVY